MSTPEILLIAVAYASVAATTLWWFRRLVRPDSLGAVPPTAATEGREHPGGEAGGTPSTAPRRDASRTPSFPVTAPGFEVARPESSRDGDLGDSGRAPNVP